MESSLIEGGPVGPAAPRGWSRPPRRWSAFFAVALVALVALSVGTDLLRHASGTGRLADLRTFYRAEESGVASCAGGLRDSLIALGAVLSGASTDRATAENIASQGEQACEPALNEILFAMAASAPPRSLAGLGAATAGSALYGWAFPGAADAQTEVGRLLRQPGRADTSARRTLLRELRALRRTGVGIQRFFDAAAARLHGRLGAFSPPIVPVVPAVLGSSVSS